MCKLPRSTENQHKPSHDGESEKKNQRLPRTSIYKKERLARSLGCLLPSVFCTQEKREKERKGDFGAARNSLSLSFSPRKRRTLAHSLLWHFCSVLVGPSPGAAPIDGRNIRGRSDFRSGHERKTLQRSGVPSFDAPNSGIRGKIGEKR